MSLCSLDFDWSLCSLVCVGGYCRMSESDAHCSYTGRSNLVWLGSHSTTRVTVI